ncbi:MAG: hypothetical protein KGI06_03625 [Candidatus Micrarchaeota archaeon]|nr:hypothetical protein [Candidatus Micrarchaeota archaeon]
MSTPSTTITLNTTTQPTTVNTTASTTSVNTTTTSVNTTISSTSIIPANTSTTSINTTTSTINTTSTTATTTVIPISENVSVVVSANNSTSVEVLNGALSLNISGNFSAPRMINILVKNENNRVPPPANYSELFEFYLSASPGNNVTINVTERYDCGVNSQQLAPFYLSNNTWVPIYNSFAIQSTCTITFSAPNNHVVGLFKYSPSGTGRKSGSSPTPAEYMTLAALIVVIVGLASYMAYLLVFRRHV